MASISNIDIKKYFKSGSNEDMKRNFKGVMSSDCFSIHKFPKNTKN